MTSARATRLFILMGVVWAGQAQATVSSWEPVPLPEPEREVEVLGLGQNAAGDLTVVTSAGIWDLRGDSFALREGSEQLPSSINRVAFVPESDTVWLAQRAALTRFADGAFLRFPVRESHLFGLDFVSDSRGWAAGIFGVALEWDGLGWRVIEDPAIPHERIGTAFDEVRAFASDDVWFAGADLPWVHFDGGSYHSHRVARARFTRFPHGNRYCGTSAGPVFSSSPSLVWDGDAWTAIPDLDGLVCVVDRDGVLWSGGEDARIQAWDGAVVRETTLPQLADVRFLSVDAAGTLWAATRRGLYVGREREVYPLHERAGEAGVNDAGHGDDAFFFRFDDDAYADLLLVNEPGEVRLFRNTGDWSFTDITGLAGLSAIRWERAVVRPCDLDNDERIDLVGFVRIDTELTPVFLRNERGLRLVDASDHIHASALGERPFRVNDVDCVDFDDDGDLDVFVTVYGDERQFPESSFLLDNDGTGVLAFRRLPARGTGLGEAYRSATVFADLRGDRRVELLALNLWSAGHGLFERDADGMWRDVTLESGVGGYYPDGFAQLVADLDGDGDLDLAFLDGASRGQLLRNDEGRFVARPPTALGSARLVGRHLRSVDLVATDLDGDGDADLALADDREGLLLLENRGDLRFESLNAALGIDALDATTVVAGDVDADGDDDLYVVRDLQPNQLYENDGATATRLLDVRSTTRSVAGATVTLLGVGGREIHRVVVPNAGLPIALPAPSGNFEQVRIEFSDGTAATRPLSNAPFQRISAEEGIRDLPRALLGTVRHRWSWMDRPLFVSRVGIGLLVLLVVVAATRRRPARIVNRARVLAGFALLFLVATYQLSEATSGIQWAVHLFLVGGLLGGATWDVRRTREHLAREQAHRLRHVAHFRLESPLGRGGMGEVWRARNLRDDTLVALKLLPAEQMSDPARRARFRREATIGGQLDHPNLVRVHEHGECTIHRESDDEETCFLSMELVEGRSLDKLLARHGPLPLGQACRIIVDACAGLAALRQAGVVHRDLKPANILVAKDGAVKLTDYGLAHAGSHTLTQTRDLMGTWLYMAPEQAVHPHVDHRADIYALAAVAFEVLTGRPPIVADEPATLLHRITNVPAALLRTIRPDLPAPLEDIIAQALAKAPGERPQRAEELAEAFVPFASRRLDPSSFPVRRLDSEDVVPREGRVPSTPTLADPIAPTTADRPDDTGQPATDAVDETIDAPRTRRN